MFRLCLLQRVKVLAIDYGHLAFKCIADKEPSLRELTSNIALTICAKVAESSNDSNEVVAASTRGSRQATIDAQVAAGGS